MEDHNAVAIVGMACRFPQSPDVASYWNNLRAGRELITFFAPDALAPESKGLSRLPGFVPAAAMVDGIDLFDASFFRMSARDAQLTDPQHRLFLEAVYTALEDAGYGDVARVDGDVGIYAGSWLSSYAANARGHLASPADEFQSLVGVGTDYLTTFVSYKLNLTGESVAIQTACSTSLVAVHAGCQSLLAGTVDVAIAGGVSIDARQNTGYVYQEGMIGSPDGHCRPFDARAQGTVRGYGLGVVVLKRLEDALADGDVIRAVIRGSATNNDGSQKIGFTAPSVRGQTRVVATALQMAGVQGKDLGYVEAHGTGTPLGDPIEIQGLVQAFGAADRQSCALGSVKSNMGHLVEAAGIAGLIKAVLILEHGEIPPTLHFEVPNPRLGLSDSPFHVPNRLVPFPHRERRLAGVSSFGIGGTNAHVVIEEAPRRSIRDNHAGQPLVFTLSAATESALNQKKAALADWLAEHPGASLGDVAYTLSAGRAALSYRTAIVATSNAELIDTLRGSTNGSSRLFAGVAEATSPGAPDAAATSSNVEALSTLAQAWVDGGSVQWGSLTKNARRLSLPSYPFQRERYWIEPDSNSHDSVSLWWLQGTGPESTAIRPRLMLVDGPDPVSLEQRLSAVQRLGRTAELDELCTVMNGAGRAGEFRAAIAFTTREELLSGVDTARKMRVRPLSRRSRPLAWIFSGTGGEQPGMGRELLRERAFREAVDAVDEELVAQAGWSVRNELESTPETSRLDRLDVIQPTIFAMQAGLSALWKSFGIEPNVVIGHSLGEIAAANVAGALSLKDAVAIVHNRSRILEHTRGLGKTMFIAWPEAEVRAMLEECSPDLAIAGVNDDAGTVVGGRPAAMAALEDYLSKRGIFYRTLGYDVPFHTPLYEPYVEELGHSLSGIVPKSGNVRIISTVNAEPHDGRGLTADYWATHLRAPVRFRDALEAVLEQGDHDFLEIGPQPVLLHSIEKMLTARRREGLAVSSLARNSRSLSPIFQAAAAFFCSGYEVRLKPDHDLVATADATDGIDPVADVQRLVARCLGVSTDQIRRDTLLVDLGMDSVAALAVLAALNRRFGTALTATDLLSAGTVSGLASHLFEKKERAHQLIVPLRTGHDAPLTLVFMPGAGGDALMMAPWAVADVTGDLNAVAINPRGHGDDSRAPLENIQDATAEYASAIANDPTPLVIVGFSLGCLSAFELACRLQQAGRQLRGFIAVHGAAPHDWGSFPLRSDGSSFDDAFTAVYDMYENMPQSREAFLAAARADFVAAEGYQHAGGYLRCPIFVVTSPGDSLVTADPSQWSTYGQDVSFYESEGEHFEFMKRAHNRELLRGLCARVVGQPARERQASSSR